MTRHQGPRRRWWPDPADLAGPAAAQVLGDVAVGHHVAGRDRLHHVEDVAGEVVELVTGSRVGRALTAVNGRWRTAAGPAERRRIRLGRGSG